MFPGLIVGERERGADPEILGEGTAGQTLKALFHQDDRFVRVEAQPASESLLMNRFRQCLFIHLGHNPCDHARSVARVMGKSLSSVSWNLCRLSEKGYVENGLVDGRKVHWPAGMVEAEDIAAVSMFRAHWTSEILGIIRDSGGHLRERDIVHAAGISQQSIHFRLGKLVSAGLLDRSDTVSSPVYSFGTALIDRARHYESRAKPFSKKVLDCFRNDGLMPKRPRLRGSRLSVEIGLPTGRSRICLECNPMASARKFVKPDVIY